MPNITRSGDVKCLTATFGWNTSSASSRMTVMTTRLRSVGEFCPNKSYSDFIDLGYYSQSYKTWKDVLPASDKFGMLYYADEQKIVSGKTNSSPLKFDEGGIPLDKNQTYYLYLWTYYASHYYPDNRFIVLRVKNVTFQFAPATGRNSYGRFTTL